MKKRKTIDQRRTKITQAILSTLAVTGVVTTIILFPGMVHAIGWVIKNSRQKADRYRYFGKAVERFSPNTDPKVM